MGVVAALGLFGIAANMAMATTPDGFWSDDQAVRFVEFQKSISDITGHPLTENIVRGERLPHSAPLDELFVAGDCAALYISPTKGLQPWLELEEELPYRHTLDITIHGPTTELGQGVPLVTLGTHPPDVVSMEPDGTGRVRFVRRVANALTTGVPVRMEPNQTYRLTIETNLSNGVLLVTSRQDDILLEGSFVSQGPVVVHTQNSQPDRPPPPVTVVDVSQPASKNSLCRSLVPKI